MIMDFSQFQDQIADFQKISAAYYPACQITAAARCKDALYLAGFDNKQMPHLYSSVFEGLWQEEVIVPEEQPALAIQYGPIRSILLHAAADQICLVCENGFLVTLPGCPKCVRTKKLNASFLGGEVSEKGLELKCEDHSLLSIPFSLLLQYRTSWSYAEEHLKKGGKLIDLRERYASPELPGSECMAMATAMKNLRDLSKDTYLFYFCQSGSRADQMTELARSIGFSHAYSLGGCGYLQMKNGGIWPGA